MPATPDRAGGGAAGTASAAGQSGGGASSPGSAGSPERGGASGAGNAGGNGSGGSGPSLPALEACNFPYKAAVLAETPLDLALALANAAPGTLIRIADGTYDAAWSDRAVRLACRDASSRP